MKCRWAIIGILILIMLAPLVGCTASSKYQALQAEYTALEAELVMLEAEKLILQDNYDEISGEYDALVSEKTTLETQNASLEAELVKLEAELAEKIYPPGEFGSLTELEDWVSGHRQPNTPYLAGSFRSALKVQDQGLKDGYLISAMFDEDDVDPTGGWVYCGALVRGCLYVWHPEIGKVHHYYADWFCR